MRGSLHSCRCHRRHHGKENTHELAGSGICGIAVISAIYGQEDIYEATASLKKVTEEMVKCMMNFTTGYQGVIFDVDGVLLDSMGIWTDLGARYLVSIGSSLRKDWLTSSSP